jgi:hypothetical protein
MTEQRKSPEQNDLTHLVDHYLSLESMEVTEDLLDLCGASIDARALLLLKRRLSEEEAQILQLEARGYVRMREKCEQLVASLRPLIEALEQMKQEEQA